MRIVHDREHRKDHGDLHTAVEVASRTGTDGNAHGEQDPAEYAAHRICRAQKDRDVPKADRAQRVAVPDGPVLHEGKDLGGGLGRFGLQVGIFRFLPRKEQELRNMAAYSSLQAGNQHVRRSVIKIAQALAHAAAEHRVDGIQDFRGGAEVFLQADHALFAPGFRIKAAFFIENLGVGKAKAINRLLQVADKEQVFSRPADRAEDLVLNPADILVFIHHHLGEARGDFFRRLGRGSVNAGQKADRQMLKIRKIQGVDAGLCAAELVFQLLHHREQGSHPARGIPKVRKDLRGGGGEQLRQFFHGLFALFPGVFELRGELRRGVVPDAGYARKGDRKARGRRVPALSEGCAEGPESPGGLGKALFIGLSDLFLGLHVRKRLFHAAAPEACFTLGILQKLPAPGRLFDFAAGIRKLLALLLGPAFRACMALHVGMELQDQLCQTAVIPSGADPVRQAQEVLRAAFVAAVQHPFQRRGAQALALLLLQNPKGGRNAQRARIFAKNRGAEGVNRTDLGIAAEKNLSAQVRVVRIPAQALGNRIGHAGAQFPRGGAGKGDHQEAVNVLGRRVGVLRVHVFHQPLGQDAGLSAARSGGDENTAAPAADGLKLCICKVHYVSS